jgi:hypothetical protein
MRGKGFEVFNLVKVEEPENSLFSGFAEYTCSAR